MNEKNKTSAGEGIDDRQLDRLIEQYLADPGSLSLEEQQNIFEHFFSRMKQMGSPEAEQFARALEVVNRSLEQARQGDPAYLITPQGIYRKQENDMRVISINQLVPDVRNLDLFRDMEGEDFEQLKCSIQEIGLIEPLIVDQELRVICGHQRLRAARAIGLQSVPVVVRWIGEEETRAIVAIEENIRRRQLQPSEIARAIKKLIELKDQKHKVDQVAQEVGLSRTQVYLYRGLDGLIPEFSSLLDAGKFTREVALRIAQLEEEVQRELHEALRERITKALEEQKAVEFETLHAGLLKELDDLSAEVKKIKQREAELKTKLNELQDRADRAEFKVGDELKAKKDLEEELQKTRAEMYRKVQEKQALMDKLTKNMESNHQALQEENTKLKATLKEIQSSKGKPLLQYETLIVELLELISTRLLPVDLKALKGKITPSIKEQVKAFIPKLETWMSDLKQLVNEPFQEKKRQ